MNENGFDTRATGGSCELKGKYDIGVPNTGAVMLSRRIVSRTEKKDWKCWRGFVMTLPRRGLARRVAIIVEGSLDDNSSSSDYLLLS